MTNISLLPPELKMRRQARRRQALYIIVGVVVLAVFFIVYLSLAFATMGVKAELQALQQQRAALEQQAATLQEYAQMQLRVEAAETLVRQAMGDLPDWAGLLADVGLGLPAGVWLTDFHAAFRNGEGELTLRGWAGSHPDVAAWLEEMRSLGKLQDVHCQFVTAEITDERQAFQYEIKARVLPGSPLLLDAEGGV